MAPKRKRESRAIVPWVDDGRRRYVYFVRDSVTNAIIYVGQTLNVKGRWQAHVRSNSSCTRLRAYIAETVHAPKFEICDSFPDGVDGEKDAYAVEAYYIAKHNTVHNMHTNPSGCNQTTGQGARAIGPDVCAMVADWIENGYTRKAAVAPPPLVEAKVQVDLFEEMDSVLGSTHAGVTHALAIARTTLAAVTSETLHQRITELSKSIPCKSHGTVVSSAEASRDFLDEIHKMILACSELHEDAVSPELPTLSIQVRRSHILFKDGDATFGFLKKLLEGMACTLVAPKREPTRAGTFRSIKAHCRPWSCRPTTEEAVRYTVYKRDNPPPNIGAYTAEELSWFDQRIRDMKTMAMAGAPRHGAVDGACGGEGAEAEAEAEEVEVREVSPSGGGGKK